MRAGDGGIEAQLHILFLSAWFPFPAVNGSKLRISSLLEILARQHTVDLISFADCPLRQLDLAEAREVCRYVELVPNRKFDLASWRARLGFFSLAPRSAKAMYSKEMADAIRERVRTQSYDRVIASETKMAAYYHCLSSIPAVFDEAQVGVLYDEWAQADSPVRRFRARLTWEKHRRYMARVVRHFGVTIVASNREQELLREVVDGTSRVELIPNCVDVGEYGKVLRQPVPGQMIFPGSFTYFPNFNAMRWFVAEILPEIQKQVPEANLVITGHRGDLPFEERPGVRHLGFVPDIRSRMAAASIMVVPIREGGGTRVKIVEAMALGVPVVSTSKGAEGLEVTHREHLLIADTPDEFRQACVSLLQNASLRSTFAANALKLVGAKYDLHAVTGDFLRLVENCRR